MLEQKDALSGNQHSQQVFGGTGHYWENPMEEIHECSVVTSTYSVGSKVMGAIGVIGPTRMEYANVYSVVELLPIHSAKS